MAPKPFEDWQLAFMKRRTSIFDNKTNELSHKPLVAEVLAEMEDVPVVTPSHAVLRHNVLFACYSAQHAPHPDADEAANDRARLRADHKALSQHAESVRRVLDFTAKHRKMAEKAMSCGADPDARAITPDARADVEEIVRLLNAHAAGLQVIMNVDHEIHITPSDFFYGPFEFGVPIETWHNKPDVNVVGLMFHLAYLFRYFTCEHLPEDIDARFHDDTGVLDLHGSMLDCGEPYTELVAPLVNAVFPKKARLSAAKVRDRLRDLARKSKGSHFHHRARFVGWSSPK